MLENSLDFFSANGYGFYIWPCYALLLVLISWQLVTAIRRNSLVRQNLEQSLKAGSASDQQT